MKDFSFPLIFTGESVKDNEEVYNLKNYKIKYYLIENERIPGLIKRNK